MKYEFPVKMHRFTTEEFNRKKAEYVAKYGYTMNIPGFSDVISIGIDRPPSELELAQYKAKDVDALGDHRFNDIKLHMAKKKESFLRMMGSPTPTWINNIGTTMTFLDNINDTAGTLSVVCRTAARLLPRTVAKAFMGPAGWALLIADIANLVMTVMRAPVALVSAKNDLADASSTNPFCKEAKVKRSQRLKRIKPTKGEIIEALQTTNESFGIGLSLGPIVGAAIEAFTGPYRVLTGKKVTVKWPFTPPTPLERAAIDAMIAAQPLCIPGQELSEEDHTKVYLTANMATQVLYPYFNESHPMDQIDGIENIEITAPRPTSPSTKAILEEAGLDPNRNIGWPYADREHTSVSELLDIGHDLNTAGFLKYAARTKHSHLGLLGGQCVNDFVQNSLALLEGEDQVELDFHPVEKAGYKLLENGYMFQEGTTSNQLQCFAEHVMRYDARDIEIPFELIRAEACPACGIRLVDRPRY